MPDLQLGDFYYPANPQIECQKCGLFAVGIVLECDTGHFCTLKQKTSFTFATLHII